jgi:TolA-binding protein
MVKTNFSNQTTDAVLTEQQYRIEALQNKIEELKAILETNNLI